MWRRQLDGLGERHSVVALDLPGHGRSERRRGPGVDRRERRTRRPLPRRGDSAGRACSWDAAWAARSRSRSRRAEPTRVRGLVLVCTAARFTLPTPRSQTARDVARGRLPQQFTTETFSPDDRHGRHARGVDGAGEDRPARALHRPAGLQGVRRPAAPVRRSRADAGRHRRATTTSRRPAQGEELARGIAGARLEVIAAGRAPGAARAARGVQSAGRGLRGALPMSMWGQVAVAGVYEHPTRWAPDKTQYQLHAESARGALADAGLTISRRRRLLHHRRRADRHPVAGRASQPAAALPRLAAIGGSSFVRTSCTPRRRSPPGCARWR